MNETLRDGALSGAEDLLLEQRGRLGVITLNRPKALNALTLAMCRQIDGQLAAWSSDPTIAAVLIKGAGERAFCAGGDVVAIYNSARGDRRVAAEFFQAEYRMNRRIFHFPKPYIALVDGIVMGGGVGVSVHGSHWVATERTLFAMPETGIGLFPDVGGSHFLPRLPGALGWYLGLTGARLKAADLCYTGIASHYLESAHLGSLEAALVGADWSGDAREVATLILAAHGADPGPAPLAAQREIIDRCFAAGSIEAILDALKAEGDDWALATRTHMLAACSPTSLKVTVRQLTEGARLEFDAAMVMEYRLSQACIAGHDMPEGVRAAVIDKDRQPRWQPASLAAVSDELVAVHFAPPAEGDLTFD